LGGKSRGKIGGSGEAWTQREQTGLLSGGKEEKAGGKESVRPLKDQNKSDKAHGKGIGLDR